jgi:hypothetical protein
MSLTDETVTQLRDLACGDSYAAFKSAALACGMTEDEADLVWRADCMPPAAGEVDLDVRDSGAELRCDGSAWLTSSKSVDLEDCR